MRRCAGFVDEEAGARRRRHCGRAKPCLFTMANSAPRRAPGFKLGPHADPGVSRERGVHTGTPETRLFGD